jgi:16S rRNA (cytosine967-C5)-methyltransferase
LAESNDARALAWEILRRVDETEAFADVVLGRRLETSPLERRDQAFATQLVYGTLAWRGFLDLAIETFARRPAASLELPIRVLLELSLFQLFKLQRVPAYAAVNSAVDLAKSHKGGRATGLVNAVLRRASGEGEAGVRLPDRGADLAGHLAARESHPRWLVERWLAGIGEASTEALLVANNTAAPTVLRANRRRLGRDAAIEAMRAAGAAVEAGVAAPEAIRFSGGSAIELEAFASGQVSLQSEASQLITLLLDPRPGERVLDACAGSGGKSTHIAELQDDGGRVVALDLHRHALARMRSEARRLGLTSIAAVQADARRAPLAGAALFDRILLDAPCTGLGTLRQHPEIRWRRCEADLASAARLQTALLAALLDHLRPGGVLVYAVCTLMPEENENVVAAVLARRPDIEREDARPFLPEAAHALVDESGALRTSPAAGGLDGFYAIRLKRREGLSMVPA